MRLQFEDNEVAFVTGNVASVASLTVPVLEPLNATRKEIEDGSEEVVDRTPRKLGHRPVTRLPQSTMIGDLKLTLLKSRLLSVGVHSEFVGEGVLLCRSKDSRSESDPNVVTVRKGSDGKVELEGTASDIYYRVRREIYGMYALVAA
jgi:cleavage and polyadenylation specificity factor subunit 2